MEDIIAYLATSLTLVATSSLLLITVAIVFFPLTIQLVSFWKIFEKANEPGWFSLVPIYGILVLLRILKMPAWFIFISAVGVPIFNIIISHSLAKAFGKSEGFFVGILFLPFIFLPILAFGGAKYIGDSTNPVMANSQQPLAQDSDLSQQVANPNPSQPPTPPTV